MKTKIVLLTFLLLCGACKKSNPAEVNDKLSPLQAASPSETSSSTPLVSIIAPIGAPERFNGRRIQVIGFTHLEFEDTAIYLSREDYEYELTKNGISLTMTKSDLARYQELSDSYLVVEGPFAADSKEHFTASSGSLENLTMLKKWAEPGTKAGAAAK
jgi:hypothetical protein